MKWFPWFYHEIIPAQDCLKVGLDPMWQWEGLFFRAFGREWLIGASVK